MESQKVVHLIICHCNFNVLWGVPAAIERFLQNRQSWGSNKLVMVTMWKAHAGRKDLTLLTMRRRVCRLP